MLRVVVAAVLLSGRTLAAPVDGKANCKCVGKISDKIERFDCDYQWAPTNKCVKKDAGYGDIDWWHDYPADYGSECREWPEPAQSVCYNNSEAQEPKVPQRLLNPMKEWCKNQWCYVDVCKCEAPDVASSTIFASLGGEMKYSYATCDGVDLFTGEYAAEKAGARCSDVKISSAKSLRVWISFIATSLFLSIKPR